MTESLHNHQSPPSLTSLHVESNEEDLFSRLPDEIVVTILSALTLKEAAQTSVISHRWMKLWTFTTCDLEFEAPRLMYKLKTDDSGNRTELLEEARNEFAKWGIKCWIHTTVLSYSNIKLLKVVRLWGVNVSGPVVEDLLSKCPSLEEISVIYSKILSRVKVTGLNLKTIEIRHCLRMNSLKVYAPNLTSLFYTDGKPRIHMNHPAPKLDALSIGGGLNVEKFPIFPEVFSSYFSQIYTLALDYRYGRIWNQPAVFPEFKILEYLKLSMCTDDEHSLLSWMSLIESCPILHTLVVQLFWIKEHKREMEMRDGASLKWLKVVEFRWFLGRSSDVELVICVLKNALHLEKITFNTWSPYSDRNPLGGEESLPYDDDLRRVAARTCARQLANEYSPKAHLVVL